MMKHRPVFVLACVLLAPTAQALGQSERSCNTWAPLAFQAPRILGTMRGTPVLSVDGAPRIHVGFAGGAVKMVPWSDKSARSSAFSFARHHLYANTATMFFLGASVATILELQRNDLQFSPRATRLTTIAVSSAALSRVFRAQARRHMQRALTSHNNHCALPEVR